MKKKKRKEGKAETRWKKKFDLRLQISVRIQESRLKG
jgi:hypothetical protein